MKYFIDITLLPGPEVPLHFLWQKVYQHIHQAFVEINHNGKICIGASFPEYDEKKSRLGSKLRLLSTNKNQLEKLNLRFTLGLVEYLHVSPVEQIPHKIQGHAVFKRIQPKNNNERLARRRAKRKRISLQQALDYFKGRDEIYSNAPYIHIQSKSTGESYRLIISRQHVQQAASTQLFSTYGLSSSSTVPIF
ncbi:MAG: type I-F CRISPR-associated endoribonuclease Cas6/Csy4 [Nitrosomonas sp.]|nr:type I-F CRISPR-associated endoribonuclease Cas6/Csy4 [Nitrosomonas sp.]